MAMKQRYVAAITVVTVGLLAAGVQAVPMIATPLTSNSFEDETDLVLVNAGEPAVGLVELSSAQAYEGESSLHLIYDGRGGAGGDFFAKWVNYQAGFDAAGPHPGYVTKFQLYPIWGSQHWRGSTGSDGGEHVGIAVYGASPGGYAVDDILVGLMDSQTEGYASLGVVWKYEVDPAYREQYVADVPLNQWTQITVYRKASPASTDVELWVGDTRVGTYEDLSGNNTIEFMGWLGNSSGFGGSGEFYLDDMQFGLIPEPATLCLLGAGAAVVLGRRRRA